MAGTMQDIVDTIVRRYAGGRDRLFILHGNTGDLFPFTAAGGEQKLPTLPDYLFQAMTPTPQPIPSRVWMHFALGFGTRWINAEANGGKARVDGLLTTDEQPLVYSNRPLDFFRMVEIAARRLVKPPPGAPKDAKEKPLPLRVIATDAHLIVPEVQVAFMRPDDRELLVLLKRFASEPGYDNSDALIILVTDALTGIHHELREVAVTAEVSRPNEREVAEYLASASARMKVPVADGTLPQLQKLVVGLTRRQIENAIAEHTSPRTALVATEFALRQRELTTRDFGDLLEFSDPDWTLTDVGGAVEAVAEFQQLAAAIVRGDPDIPSGLIVAGQNGVGKTHILKAFAGTVRTTFVTLRSFKSSGYGDSERAWDKIATALTSAGQIIVGIEEADGVLGRRTGPNVHEVSRAILSKQLALMGDPKYRGRILWLLDTCRPDKLAPDVKRPGRCERVISLFPETTAEGIRAVIAAQVGLLGRQLGYRFADGFVANVSEDLLMKLAGKSGAQIKRALERTRRKYAPATAMTVGHLQRFVAEDVSFKSDPEAYELQRLIAIAEAIETENADLVPKFYLDQLEVKYGGIGGMKERIELLRRRIDGD